jgi:hypothetical protein
MATRRRGSCTVITPHACRQCPEYAYMVDVPTKTLAPAANRTMVTSVNMNRQPDAMHMLLHETPADILLIQEPWWGLVSTGRSDSDAQGVVTKGPTVQIPSRDH